MQRVYLRFVDDPHHVESCDGTSVLGGLALGVVKVGWHCHDGMSDRVSKVGLCRFLGREQEERSVITGWDNKK